MDEILYEFSTPPRLNAGRWDYLFSVIKFFRDAGPEYVLPDRGAVTMTAPIMRAYTELLGAVCHRRGALAIGGMAASIPCRRDPEVNEVALAKVREDKTREAGDGFDGRGWPIRTSSRSAARRSTSPRQRPNQSTVSARTSSPTRSS